MTKHVSFDLDGTLFGCEGPVEPLGRVGRMLGAERLRLGTRRLFGALNERGCTVSIYTTSLRSHRNIRNTFRWHGLRLKQIVNGDDHRVQVQEGSSSKRPDNFGFDFHVDDAPIGAPDQSKVRVIIVASSDRGWVDAVLNQVSSEPQTH